MLCGASATVIVGRAKPMMFEALAVTPISAKTAAAPAVVAFVEGHTAVMRLQHAAERLEARLLVIGEGLVQRSAGIGDLL